MKFDRTTDESIRFLVEAFYEKVRAEPQLAPLFTKAIGSDWNAHIATMCDFWGAAMHVSARYRGDMLTAHQPLDGLRPELFARWLELFEQTVDAYFVGDAGTAIRDRARKIARNLQLALFHRASAAHPVAST